MKEERYFYVPDAASTTCLPEEEAQHASRVLRLQEGDPIVLIDGVGNFHTATLTEVTKKHCHYAISDTQPQQKAWNGTLHVAVAPTKNMDRMEWFVEKATEIGFDRLSPLRCQYSERTVVKAERLMKIIVSAMKQSHKAHLPQLDEMTDFRRFIAEQDGKPGRKYICHCYDLPDSQPKQLLRDVLASGDDTLVLIGPEGDFSVDEVHMAEKAGFIPVSLGASRLRTETAALVAVHLMNLSHT